MRLIGVALGLFVVAAWSVSGEGPRQAPAAETALRQPGAYVGSSACQTFPTWGVASLDWVS